MKNQVDKRKQLSIESSYSIDMPKDLSKYDNYKMPSADKLAEKLIEVDIKQRANQTNKPLKRLVTDLNFQPIESIICLHIRNLVNMPELSKNILTRHICNLELTYGYTKVEATIKTFFPDMFVAYYG